MLGKLAYRNTKRNIKDYTILTLKGMGMGAADVVPGVSGGTIAFIVGIYEELINSIKSVDLKTLKLLFTFKWKLFTFCNIRHSHKCFLFG